MSTSPERPLDGNFSRAFPARLRRAIGDVVIASGQLEYLILVGLKRSGDSTGLLTALHAASAVGGIEARRSELRRRMLAKAVENDPRRVSIETLFGHLGMIFKERDKIVHGTLGVDPEFGPCRIRVGRGKIKDHRFDPIDLTEYAQHCIQVAGQMKIAANLLDGMTRELFW